MIQENARLISTLHEVEAENQQLKADVARLQSDQFVRNTVGLDDRVYVV